MKLGLLQAKRLTVALQRHDALLADGAAIVVVLGPARLPEAEETLALVVASRRDDRSGEVGRQRALGKGQLRGEVRLLRSDVEEAKRPAISAQRRAEISVYHWRATGHGRDGGAWPALIDERRGQIRDSVRAQSVA